MQLHLYNPLIKQITLLHTVGAVVENIASSADGLRLIYRAGQMGHSVATGSPPLRCLIEAVLARR